MLAYCHEAPFTFYHENCIIAKIKAIADLKKIREHFHAKEFKEPNKQEQVNYSIAVSLNTYGKNPPKSGAVYVSDNHFKSSFYKIPTKEDHEKLTRDTNYFISHPIEELTVEDTKKIEQGCTPYYALFSILFQVFHHSNAKIIL